MTSKGGDNMAGPSKKETSQAAKDLASPKSSKSQKSEAAETLNYAKNTKSGKK